jgi:hypothetical protein
MAQLEAVLAFLQGAEAHRRRARSRLYGSPCIVRLTYLGGHPGIWQQAEFWAGLVSDRLRLVDARGEQCYDLPLDRIGGLSYDADGRLRLDYEPTAGLVTTLAFEAEEGREGYQKLRHMMLGA